MNASQSAKERIRLIKIDQKITVYLFDARQYYQNRFTVCEGFSPIHRTETLGFDVFTEIALGNFALVCKMMPTVLFSI